MPEGPSIFILKEQVQIFKGKKVVAVIGNSKTDIQRVLNHTVIDFKSWGKHFLICFNNFTIRIHFMLFGSYSINEEKERPPRLGLKFKSGALNFYTCSVKFMDEAVNATYDWSEDIMSDDWDAAAAKKKLKSHPKIELEVLKVNFRAKRFYEDLGFKAFEEKEDVFQMIFLD